MTYEEALFIMEEVMDDYRPSGDCEIAFRKALASLEKQIPKKPIRSKRVLLNCEVWECPICGFEWCARIAEYCYKCGQALDWGDEDE